MSKKQIPVIIILLLLGASAIFFLFSSKQDVKKSAPIITPSPTPTAVPVTLVTWTDEAGFSFQYPEGTEIDKHPEDTKNYANLTLTLPSREIINIKMSDNSFKNLDAWVGDNSAIDTTLEGRPAKKIKLDGLETVASIDNEVLVTIEGKNVAGIVNSWTFIYPTAAPAKKITTQVSEDTNVLEEE